MKRLFAALPIGVAAMLASSTAVWSETWIQIEAQPSLTQATEAAQRYSASLPNVVGFDLPGRWHAIAIGPFADDDEADAYRRSLLAVRQIPSDSYLSDGSRFGAPFWPVGASLAAIAGAPAPTATTDAPVEVAQPIAPAEETPAQARASERELDRDAREALQVALKFAGHYSAAIDGSFGPGTRNAMAAWQIANAFEPTGVLSTKQRDMVLSSYRNVLDGLGIARVSDDVAGIEIDLPLGVVTFDAYTPPFAKFSAKDGSGVQVLLISQTGDRDTLGGLYEIMQTLEIVPVEGPRERGERAFTLVGANDQIVSHTEARLFDGTVKGWTLIWPAGDESRRQLALAAMRESFTPLRDAVLPDSYGAGGEQDIDLLAGLEIRRADAVGTGFFVSDAGAVLTTSTLVENCRQITLDENTEATVTSMSDGLALLTPTTPVAPLAVARFDAHLPRLQSDVAVSGFAYEGRLGAPTLNYGILAEHRGLAGETDLLRLDMTTLPGEAGGPLFNSAGGVIGILAPHSASSRALPENVSFAYDMEKLVSFLSEAGVTVAASEATEALSDPDLVELGRNLSTLVSCWTD
ncbi:serine protease [Celeribacter arenosi]|uniref:Trypsin-like peptidase domain-containing protein n=1 Tax=Celeribacter arenosi TaxID=792649 RepID=A0ABP7K9S9_9RHOB